MKKYTLEEFHEYYQEKIKEVLQKLMEDFKEQAEKHNMENNFMAITAFSMQNIMVAAEIEKALFEENK